MTTRNMTAIEFIATVKPSRHVNATKLQRQAKARARQQKRRQARQDKYVTID